MGTSTILLPSFINDENPVNLLAQQIINNFCHHELKDNGDMPIIGLVCAVEENSPVLVVKCCKTFEYVVVDVSDSIYQQVKKQSEPLIFVQLEPMKAALIYLNKMISFNGSQFFNVLDEEEFFQVILDTVIEFLNKNYERIADKNT